MKTFRLALLFVLWALVSQQAAAQRVAIENPGFEDGTSKWFLIQHAGEAAYRFTVDSEKPFAGKGSAKLEQYAPQAFGLFKQRINARPYVGKRLKLTAKMRAKDVKESGGVLYVRIDGPGDAILSYDFTSGRTNGTHDWKPFVTVVEIPAGAVEFEFGMMLDNFGTLWGDDFAIEVTTDAITNKPIEQTPDALTFENVKPQTQDERRPRRKLQTP
jgi:hypothetical protein